MSLELQFQSVMASFLYGLCLGFSYGLFNRVFFFLSWRFLRTLLEIVFDALMLSGYFFLMVALNKGHFNLYLFLALALGVVFYESGFAGGYLYYLEGVMRIFGRLFYPIRFIFSKIRGILKQIRKVTKRGKAKKEGKIE